MSPIRIVHRGEVHVVLVAHERRHHHVGTVKRMHLRVISLHMHYKVRRKCRTLPPRQHRKYITTSHLSPSPTCSSSPARPALPWLCDTRSLSDMAARLAAQEESPSTQDCLYGQSSRHITQTGAQLQQSCSAKP